MVFQSIPMFDRIDTGLYGAIGRRLPGMGCNAQSVMMSGFHSGFKLIGKHFHSHNLDPIDTVHDPRAYGFSDFSHAIGTARDIATMSSGNRHRFAAGEDAGPQKKTLIKGISPSNVQIFPLTDRADTRESVAKPIHGVQSSPYNGGRKGFVVLEMIWVGQKSSQMHVNVPKTRKNISILKVQ